MFIIIILSLSLPHIPRSTFSFFSLPFLPPFPLPLFFPFPLSSLLFSFPFLFLFFPLFLFPFLFLSLSSSFPFLFSLPFPSFFFPFFFPLPFFPFPIFALPSRFLVSGGAVCPPCPPIGYAPANQAVFVTYLTKGRSHPPQIFYNKGPMMLYLVPICMGFVPISTKINTTNFHVTSL